MPGVDLTGFGFTPTESLVYEALLRSGTGTGYAVARAAGLARANAYSALEGLVSKGAARVEPGRPRRYRPEAPAVLIARISNNHGLALERLSGELDRLAVPDTPTAVEIESGRAALQLMTHDIARVSQALELLAPPDAYPLVAPALRRPVSAGARVSLWSTGPVELEFVEVNQIQNADRWPGMPILMVADDQRAIIGSRVANEVHGHWSSAPPFVAAARLALERLTATA
jgi:HTH-type transcriptional regulator, sugar sensing transcriptional regulator